MPKFQSPRGTRDILPQDQAVWRFVRQAAEKTAFQLGYRPITIPTYEEAGLFRRAIGEGTDIQDKELFLVRGVQSAEEQYALRPEGTAGIVRAFIEHGMHTWPQPVKLFSLVNNFRYDRPQKGRYREHVQFDVEYFGDTGPFADAWVIYTGWLFFRNAGLKNVSLAINTLGTIEEREAYLGEFTRYCREHLERLSEDSKRRLATNPLRILDSKDEGDRSIAASAPQLIDFLSEESKAHFEKVLSYLGTWNIPFSKDPYLVRGLDYYSHTAFEWITTGTQGQQGSLGGGGRYDGLLQKLEGPAVGAVGAGIGMDRVVEELLVQSDRSFALPLTDLYLVAADEHGKENMPILLERLLSNMPDLLIDYSPGKPGVGAGLKKAAKTGARFAAIIGESETATGLITLKDLSSGEQFENMSLKDVSLKLANG